MPPRNHKAIVLMIINGVSALLMGGRVAAPTSASVYTAAHKKDQHPSRLIGSWGFVQTGSILLASHLNTSERSLFAKSTSLSNKSTMFHTVVSNHQSIIFKSFTTWLLDLLQILWVLVRPELIESFSSPLIGPVIFWLAEDSHRFVRCVNPDFDI